MSDETDDLKLKIFELTAEVTAANVRTRALQDLFALVLEEDFGRDVGFFQSALQELERDRANEMLRSLSDYNPDYTSILKTYLDQHFPTKSEDDLET